MDPAMFEQMGLGGDFLETFWDSPMVCNFAFQPRKDTAGRGAGKGVADGTVGTKDGAKIGYRLYNALERSAVRAVCVYFHGNAEVCTDLQHGIDSFYAAGLAVASFDYRGFGWSTSNPTLGRLCPDADAIAAALPKILADNGLADAPCILFGRSIGATSAVHLASSGAAVFKGLVIESGLMAIKELPLLGPLAMMIPNGQMMLQMVPEPMLTLQKMARVKVPTLILHGTSDQIVPYAQAEKANAACGAPVVLERFDGAGHNDGNLGAPKRYFDAVSALVDRALGGASAAPEPAPALTEELIRAMSVKQLKAAIKQHSLDASGCVEKSELVALLLATL